MLNLSEYAGTQYPSIFELLFREFVLPTVDVARDFVIRLVLALAVANGVEEQLKKVLGTRLILDF